MQTFPALLCCYPHKMIEIMSQVSRMNNMGNRCFYFEGLCKIYRSIPLFL